MRKHDELDLIRKIWERCERDPETGCWNWTGFKDALGYGRMGASSFRKTPMQPYRVAYQLFVGEIPDGKHLHHKCHNPSCCNPDHLEPLTPAEHSRAHHGDTCPAGHGEEHWHITPRGSRYCRECDRERVAKRRRDRRVPCIECGEPRTNPLDFPTQRDESAPDSGLCRKCWLAARWAA